MRDALRDAPAPVVAVSPARPRRGAQGPDRPTACAGPAATLDSDGIADHYEGLLDGLVADQRAERVPTLETDVELDDAEAAPRASRASALDVRRRASVTGRDAHASPILPVKRFGRAKQRLSGALASATGAGLAAAMVADVLDALARGRRARRA